MGINLQAEAAAYNQKLHSFFHANRLPNHWFTEWPPDHIAFKAYNPDEYNNLVDQFRPISAQITEVWQADRRLAAAQLLGEHALDLQTDIIARPGILQWVELMEAKPDDQADGKQVELDHAEIFLSPGLAVARTFLQRNGISFVDQENEAHSWISLKINDEGDELKLTDRRLEWLIRDDLKMKRARIL
jgi:hypothetical protein